jgi:hypothetical protein
MAKPVSFACSAVIFSNFTGIALLMNIELRLGSKSVPNFT